MPIELQPVNQAVKPILFGEDCTMVVIGIGFGKNRVSTAMSEAYTERHSVEAQHAPIRSIHSLALTDWGFLNLVGARCLEVTGEP